MNVATLGTTRIFMNQNPRFVYYVRFLLIYSRHSEIKSVNFCFPSSVKTTFFTKGLLCQRSRRPQSVYDELCSVCHRHNA